MLNCDKRYVFNNVGVGAVGVPLKENGTLVFIDWDSTRGFSVNAWVFGTPQKKFIVGYSVVK